jgi:hypothetical protein
MMSSQLRVTFLSIKYSKSEISKGLLVRCNAWLTIFKLGFWDIQRIRYASTNPFLTINKYPANQHNRE